jgi:hypothetical protein
VTRFETIDPVDSRKKKTTSVFGALVKVGVKVKTAALLVRLTSLIDNKIPFAIMWTLSLVMFAEVLMSMETGDPTVGLKVWENWEKLDMQPLIALTF